MKNAKWTLTLVLSKYTKVGDEYKMVELEEELEFDDFDDVMNCIAYRVEGAPGTTKKFELRYDKEDM